MHQLKELMCGVCMFWFAYLAALEHTLSLHILLDKFCPCFELGEAGELGEMRKLEKL